MKKMIIIIGLIIIFFAMLITGIVTYTKITKNPDSFNFVEKNINISLDELSLEKKTKGELKLDITDVVVEEDFITIHINNNFDLEVFGIPVNPIHDHSEETENNNNTEQFYYANVYFEVYDEKGNIINDPNYGIMELKEKQGFVVLATNPEKGNEIKIKVFERTTQTFLGETEVKFRY